MTRRCLTRHDWRPDPVHLFGVCGWCGVVNERPQPHQLDEVSPDLRVYIDGIKDGEEHVGLDVTTHESVAEAYALRWQTDTSDEPEDDPDEPGPQVTVRRALVTIGWTLFVMLAACGCIGWLVEWLR